MSWIKWFLDYLRFEKTNYNLPPVDLDLGVGLDWLLVQAQQLAPSEACFWVSLDEFHAIKRSIKTGNYIPKQSYFKEFQFRSLQPVDNEVVVKIIAALPEGRLTTVAEGSSICVPVYHPEKHSVFGYLIVAGVDLRHTKKFMQRLSGFISEASRYLSYCFQFFDANSQTLRDDLTSLFNQKCLSMILESEIHRSQRDKSKFSVLFIDIDHFKKVNDTMGHWVGSHLLVELGGLLGSSVRKSDYAFRYGGDEFVVVVPSTDAEGAKTAAERIRAKVEENSFCVDGEEIQITLSIGIATFPDHAQSHEEIIKMADEAMYNGKNKSRNIVLLAG